MVLLFFIYTVSVRVYTGQASHNDSRNGSHCESCEGRPLRIPLVCGSVWIEQNGMGGENIAGRVRNKQVVIRMTEEEYGILKSKVQRSGMKQAEYLIRCITGKPVVNTAGMRELAAEVKKVGVNLNQIAHALNGKGYYDYRLISRNQQELGEVWQLLKQNLQKVR